MSDATRGMADRPRSIEHADTSGEALYQLLFESIDEGFCIIEKVDSPAGVPSDFRYIAANPAFAAQSGVGNVIGKTIRETFPSELETWFDTYDAILDTGRAVRFERGLVTTGRVLELYAFRVDAVSRRVAILFVDLTARRQVEADRSRLELELETQRTALLESIFRLAPSFLAVLRGPEYVFALANEAYVQLIGRGRDILGKPMFEALPELVGQGFDVIVDRVLATGEPFVVKEIPARIERTLGAPAEDRVITLTVLPLEEPDGTRSGVVAHGTDVTEYVLARNQGERLLEASERTRADAEAARGEAEHARERTAQLQQLTSALAGARTLDEVATVVVAQITKALSAQTGALAVLAPSADALHLVSTVGFPDAVAQLVRVQLLDMVTPLTECFRTRAPVWIERRDGPAGLDARFPLIIPVWDALAVESAAFLPLIAAGEAVGTISFAFAGSRTFAPDERALLLTLTQQASLAVERASLYSAELRARRDAEVANRAKAEFLATMSHELRTPLNAIGGYAELIELGVYGAVTPEQRTALERIQRSQRHLLGLINGVLDYAKVDAGAVSYVEEAVPLDELLAICEALIVPQVRKKGLTFMYTGCDPQLNARADREKVQQVVLNLLSNAVKFTAPGGRVTLTCAVFAEGVPNSAGSGHVEIHVADTGNGIALEELERVFQPFVQLDAQLTRAQEGTGLGLAISRNLARGMGGDLTVESTVGAGSTFTLVLPSITG